MSTPTLNISVSDRKGEKPEEAQHGKDASTASGPLSDAEKSAANEVSAAWPFPAERDGWCKIHIALTKGLADFKKAISACKDRKGALEPWMARNLIEFYSFYSHALHHHHDSEEDIVFPFMMARVKALPQRFSSDHKEILGLVDGIKADLDKLAATGQDDHQATLDQILDLVTKLEEINLEHFREEEDEALPLLRHHFTEKEFQPCLKKILAKQSTMDLGFLLNGFPTREDQVAWCRDIARIPGPIISLVIMPGLKKYVKKYVNPLEDVVAGQQRPQSGGLCCLGC